jgi:hypothetical protein
MKTLPVPFIASYPPDWDRAETEHAIAEATAGGFHYDPIRQISNIPLEAGTSQTYRTTRSGGPVYFSDDDSKVTDG